MPLVVHDICAQFPVTVTGSLNSIEIDVVGETFDVLRSLGHSEPEARKLLDAVLATKTKFKDVESLIQAVYQHSSGNNIALVDVLLGEIYDVPDFFPAPEGGTLDPQRIHAAGTRGGVYRAAAAGRSMERDGQSQSFL